MKLAKVKKIMIVEDSLEIQILLRRLFESENYEVDFASNGRDALEKLRNSEHMPELILLDLMMPVMDGFQFRAEQEQDLELRRIPIIIMTAARNIDMKGAKLGAIGSLKKPFDLDTLLDTVNKYCS